MSDQAETVLYRLASSSGPRALAAMRPRDGDLVRPLLSVTAADTRAWCDARGLEPRIDATNDDPDVSPQSDPARGDAGAAAGCIPGAEVNLARTAELLAELDELLVRARGRPRRRRDRSRRPGRAASRAAGAGAARRRRTCRGTAACGCLASSPDGSSRSPPAATAASGCRSGATSRRCATAEPSASRRRPVSSLAMSAELEHAGEQSLIAEVLVSGQALKARVAELGAELSRDYAGSRPAADRGAEGRGVLHGRPDPPADGAV